MKIVSKAIRVAVAGGMIAGMMAIGSSSDAAVTTVASCSGMKGLGSIKSTTLVALVADGLTDKDDQDAAVSAKGIDPTVLKGTNLGSCNFTSGLSTPDAGKPAVKGYSGTKNVAKWGLKLASVETDCNTADTTDLTEWPLSGALSIGFTDLTAALKAQSVAAYVTVDGFSDPDNDPNTPSDVVEAHGLVVKGVAVGADVQSNTYFDPVIADKTQTTNTPHFGYQFDVGAALGCTTATIGDANVRTFVLGDGPSLLLALPASGITLTIGS